MAIGNQQKNQQEKAALQDSLAIKREEARVLLEEKTAALKRIDELEKQLTEGQVSHAVHAGPELPAVHAVACFSLTCPPPMLRLLWLIICTYLLYFYQPAVYALLSGISILHYLVHHLNCLLCLGCHFSQSKGITGGACFACCALSAFSSSQAIPKAEGAKSAQGSAAQLAAERAAEQKQHAEQTAQLEAQIQALDSLRYDLEQAKANLTAKLEMSSATNTGLEIQILEVSKCLICYGQHLSIIKYSLLTKHVCLTPRSATAAAPSQAQATAHLLLWLPQ